MDSRSSGLCACGCGQRTRLTPSSDVNRGFIRGEPRRYVNGHNAGTPIEQRLARYTDMDGPVHPILGTRCHIWTSARCLRPFDYGLVTWKGATHRVHRVVWELAQGPIPPGSHVLHHCDTPPCCRLDHLFLGDNHANQQDFWEKHQTRKRRRPALSDEAVRAIRSDRAEGETIRALVERYCVDERTIVRLLRRELYARVV